MRDERVDQGRPLFVILGRRHVAAVMEDGLGSGRERRGHETQFDEWSHANRQEKVDDLIGVENESASSTTQTNFLDQNKANDRIKAGVGYVF